jgi:predicted nucleic acid-binding protein
MPVVDASVAFKWVVREEGSEAARALVAAGEPLIAPELVLVEVANAAWKGARRGLVAPGQLAVVAERLPDWLDRIHPVRPLLPRAVAIARDLDHPVYDCVYLALAEREAAALVTADLRLLARAAGSPWAGLVRELGADARPG